MTDFDVVREGLGDALNPDYYYEALARIEAQVQRLTEDRDKLKTAIVSFSDMGLVHRDWSQHVGVHDGATDQEMHGFDRCTNCGRVNVHWPECAINVNARHGCTCVAADGSRAARGRGSREPA